MNRINNRVVQDEDLTFYQWLNIFEFITKREFKEFSEEKKANYWYEYQMWIKGISQYNR